MKTEAAIRGVQLQVKDTKDCWQPPQVKREAGNSLPQEPPEGISPDHTWILDFQSCEL